MASVCWPVMVIKVVFIRTILLLLRTHLLRAYLEVVLILFIFSKLLCIVSKYWRYLCAPLTAVPNRSDVVV
jgi:hypothetical protein